MQGGRNIWDGKTNPFKQHSFFILTNLFLVFKIFKKKKKNFLFRINRQWGRETKEFHIYVSMKKKRREILPIITFPAGFQPLVITYEQFLCIRTFSYIFFCLHFRIQKQKQDKSLFKSFKFHKWEILFNFRPNTS